MTESEPAPHRAKLRWCFLAKPLSWGWKTWTPAACWMKPHSMNNYTNPYNFSNRLGRAAVARSHQPFRYDASMTLDELIAQAQELRSEGLPGDAPVLLMTAAGTVPAGTLGD